MAKRYNLLIATGTTGGHFFPAMSIAIEAAHKCGNYDVAFVLPRPKSRFTLPDELNRFRVEFLDLEPFPNPFSFKLFLFLINYARILLKALSLIREIKPNVLLSFGSYGSFPTVIAAWLNRVPIIVHEQNRIAGKANQCAGVFARYFLTSFPETIKSLPTRQLIYTGYPLRQSLHQAAKHRSVNLAAAPYCILVLGGSQGSQAVNETTLSVFSQLTPEEKSRIAVIHMTGEKQHNDVKKHYDSLNLRSEIIAFSNSPEQYFMRADLVVARAGAGTIFELAAFGIPSILIPYPYAHGHQVLNARYVEQRGGCVVIEEKDLSANALRSEIFRILDDQDVHYKMQASARKLYAANAVNEVIRLITDICDKRKMPQP